MDKYPWQDFSPKIKNIYRLAKRRENITVNAIKQVLDTISGSLSEDPIYCYLKHIVDNFYIDTVIETKECAPEPTYCFNMPKTHSFIVNGFYSSNCQGSDCPVIIGVIDYSTPPQMLTSQLIYTLLTRAKKKCVLVAQNRALQKAISTDYVSHKRTFLPEMLKFDKDKLEDMGYGKQEWNDSEDNEDEDNEFEEENEIDNGSIFD